MTAVSKVREIDEGFSFDLGNFHLDVIHLPGTICLKHFFSSDQGFIHLIFSNFSNIRKLSKAVFQFSKIFEKPSFHFEFSVSTVQYLNA